MASIFASCPGGWDREKTTLWQVAYNSRLSERIGYQPYQPLLLLHAKLDWENLLCQVAARLPSRLYGLLEPEISWVSKAIFAEAAVGVQEQLILSDGQSERMAAHIIGDARTRASSGRDDHRFVEALLWVVRTGSPWRDPPDAFGP